VHLTPSRQVLKTMLENGIRYPSPPDFFLIFSARAAASLSLRCAGVIPSSFPPFPFLAALQDPSQSEGPVALIPRTPQLYSPWILFEASVSAISGTRAQHFLDLPCPKLWWLRMVLKLALSSPLIHRPSDTPETRKQQGLYPRPQPFDLWPQALYRSGV